MQFVDCGHVVNFPSNRGSDAVHADTLSGLFILCDGANGCRDGGQAAKWLSRYLGENLDILKDAPNPGSSLEESICNANDFLIENFAEGCSTVAGLYLAREQAICFSVGDSYLYVFNKEVDCWKLATQLPRDVDAAGNPWQLVGSEAFTTVHHHVILGTTTQAFILLSDGVGNCLKREDIMAHLPAIDGQMNLNEVAARIAQEALDRGSKDDVSALIIRTKSEA